MNSKNNKKAKIEDINTRFDENLDDISITGSSLLGNNNDSQYLFSKDNLSFENFVIVKIHFMRATLKEASIFKEFLESTISNDEKNIVIDMNSCEFVDSSFFSVLIGGLKRLGRMGMQLYIVHDSSDKMPIFSATGLDKIFKVFNTIEEAIKS